jgi:hypothetical protein
MIFTDVTFLCFISVMSINAQLKYLDSLPQLMHQLSNVATGHSEVPGWEGLTMLSAGNKVE